MIKKKYALLKCNLLIQQIPHLLTLLNLFCGCIAIVSLLNYKKYFIAALMIFLASIADFLDGFIARLLNSKSLIGKYLDSLSDLISFGLVPAIFLFLLIEENYAFKDNFLISLLPWTAFFITIFSAWRLAKFNIYDNQLDHFKGLNTTANTVFFISLNFITPYDIGYNIIYQLIKNPISILIIISLSCILLLSNIPMFSLKIDTLSWHKNKYRYQFFLLSILLMILLGKFAIPCLVILYIIFSLIINFL